MRRRGTVCFIVMIIALFSIVPLAFASEEAGALDSTVKSAIAIASGFAIGVAAFGGGMGQGRAIAAGLEGIARNPGASGQIMTPMIIGLALIESLVIYALVISFMLYAKL